MVHYNILGYAQHKNNHFRGFEPHPRKHFFSSIFSFEVPGEIFNKKIKRKNVSLGGARTHENDYFCAAHYLERYNEPSLAGFTISALHLTAMATLYLRGLILIPK